MNKHAAQEAYGDGYRYGVKLALDSCGIVKTAQGAGVLQRALEGVKAMPGWGKGMAVGAPVGAGVGAVGGGDLEDILSGALGGAAAGGLIGGAPALGQRISPRVQKALERYGGGDVGAMRREAAGLGERAAGKRKLTEKLWDKGLPGAAEDAWKAKGRLTGEQNAALELMQEAAGAQARKISPRLIQALGIGAGGVGTYGALSD